MAVVVNSAAKAGISPCFTDNGVAGNCAQPVNSQHNKPKYIGNFFNINTPKTKKGASEDAPIAK
jgi:hypothetical protein